MRRRFLLEDVVVCEGCGQPMIPNLSTEDEDGMGWSCTTYGCGDFTGEQIEAEDLIACGVEPWMAKRMGALSDAYLELLTVVTDTLQSSEPAHRKVSMLRHMLGIR